MAMDSGLLLDMYRKMVTIRAFDTRAVQEFTRAASPAWSTPTSARRPSPWACVPPFASPTASPVLTAATATTIAKGADINLMMAELFGRSNGYCHGKGGSMHIADFSVGMLGANGIVGAGCL